MFDLSVMRWHGLARLSNPALVRARDGFSLLTTSALESTRVCIGMRTNMLCYMHVHCTVGTVHGVVKS